MNRSLSILGIGWVTAGSFGCIRLGTRSAGGPGAEVFSAPFKNYGRLDAVSRTTAHAVALALQDAGISYGIGRKQDIGIVGTNREGSLITDREYFHDYINGGRTLSRANLFIYTLPSSPFGEAAIHFGLTGPLVYVADQDGSLAAALDTTVEMLRNGEAGTMLAGRADKDDALFLVVSPSAGTAGSRDLDGVRGLLDQYQDIASLVPALEQALAKQ